MNVKRTLLALVALLPFAVTLATAAEGPGDAAARRAPTNLRFQHLTPEDGLSQGIVYAILEDRRGFMWFGTAAGLDRYDGTGIKTFRNDPDDPDSLLGTSVQSLYEDPDGALWAVTNQGLNRFDRATEKFKRYTFDPQNPGGLSGADMARVAADRSDESLARIAAEVKELCQGFPAPGLLV